MTTRIAKGPYGEYLYGSGYVPLTGYTGHVQTEPNGLIYMRGRFYSPAWHVFLNSDQGADPHSLNQYAYAGGNPFINVDPSGMSFWGDLLDPLHMAHSARVNWNHGRRGIEVGAAVVACIVVDYLSCGTASDTNPEIMAAAEGGTEVAVAGTGAAVAGTGVAAAGATSFAIPAYVGYDAAIGAVAGGLIDARGSDWWSWKGAFQGAIYGAALGSGYDCISTGISSGSWQAIGDRAALYGQYAMKPATTLEKVAISAGMGGMTNMAFGDAKSPWNDFRDGMEIGGLSALAGYSGIFGQGAGGYIGSNLFGHTAYGMFPGHGPTVSDFGPSVGLGVTSILLGW